MQDAASDKGCVQRSDEPWTAKDTEGGAPNSGGVDLSIRTPPLQHVDEQSQWEWEMFGPPPRPDDDGDLDSNLGYEFEVSASSHILKGSPTR